MDRSRALPLATAAPTDTALSGLTSAAGSGRSCPYTGANAAATASPMIVLPRDGSFFFIAVSDIQRSLNCGVGLVVLGLFDPWTSVWQLRQPRAIVMLIAFFPLVVTVFGTTCLPSSWGTFGPCGVWHWWHRNGGRAFSRFSTTVPCGLWQFMQ